MKTEIQIKRYGFIALLIVLILLSISIAFLTYRYYSNVVRGILGLVLLYLLFFGGRYAKNDVSIHTMLLDPKKGKYLIVAFIDPLISYWATLQIYEMILFFWKR
jgi:ABC-type arginine transport system permease subunit